MNAFAPETLLLRLRAEGVWLRRRGDRIHVLPPAGADVEALRRVIVEAKAGLLALLPDQDTPKPSRRAIVRFRLSSDRPTAWATALAAPGVSAEDVIATLKERHGDMLILEEIRPDPGAPPDASDSNAGTHSRPFSEPFVPPAMSGDSHVPTR